MDDFVTIRFISKQRTCEIHAIILHTFLVRNTSANVEESGAIIPQNRSLGPADPCSIPYNEHPDASQSFAKSHCHNNHLCNN